MRAERLEIPEVVAISPKQIVDARGSFCEVFKADWFRSQVADEGFVQDNQSLSLVPGTVRGLHFQIAPFAQGKLVRCLTGAIFDVAVDIRIGSPTYGKWLGEILSAENGKQLWIPQGFAHGFATLEVNTIVHYKVTAPYSFTEDRGLAWDDPELGISWPIEKETAILSDKDRKQPRLASLAHDFTYEKANFG